MLSTSSRWEIFKRDFGFMIGRMSNTLGYHMTKRMSDIAPYKNGLLGKQHPLSGARFFPSQVQSIDGANALIDDLTGDQFALIAREPVGGEAVDWLCSQMGAKVLVLGKDFKDKGDRMAQYFTENNADVVLVRPDLYIFDAGKSANDLSAALREKLFGHGMSA